MDLRELLTHELGPLPWSLASFDGLLAKTNKAFYLSYLKMEWSASPVYLIRQLLSS